MQDSDIAKEYNKVEYDPALFRKGQLIAHAFPLDGDEWDFFVGAITLIRKTDNAKWIKFEDGEHIKVSMNGFLVCCMHMLSKAHTTVSAPLWRHSIVTNTSTRKLGFL